VRAYWFKTVTHNFVEGARKTWVSWAIFLIFVVGPGLGDDNEGMFVLRLLTFGAGVFAGWFATRG
jgi:hypothetical protein